VRKWKQDEAKCADDLPSSVLRGCVRAPNVFQVEPDDESGFRPGVYRRIGRTQNWRWTRPLVARDD
jgi:hypothetical protein